MKRREFVTGVIASGLAAQTLSAQGHQHGKRVDGPLANATVSFGAWPSDPPFDRFVPPPPGPPPNIHELIPHTVRIKAGGTVNFILAGFHNVQVFAPGTRPEHVDSTKTVALPGAPMGFPPIIDDPINRVYRGPNPFPLPQDRVEVVHFAERGRYLVICGFLPHFLDDMFGWVEVVK